MEIPIESLSAEILRSVIEEFITREGTDYGSEQFDLEQKVAQVKAILERGKAKIMYDFVSESCHIVSSDDELLTDK